VIDKNKIKDEYISIRCTEQVKNYLNTLANQDDRSLSAQVMYMLKQTDGRLAKLMQKTSRSDVPIQEKAEQGQDPF
jgi:hypothetical protein